jgi:hypothetical protein
LFASCTCAISRGWQFGHPVWSPKTTEKIDPREVYGDDGLRIDCDCKMERACAECVDGGLYDDGQLPDPPPFILIDIPLTEEEVTRKLASTDAGKV